MSAPLDDDLLCRMLKDQLSTAVVGDVLDKLGYFHQFLPAEIKPLKSEMKVAGRAMTVLEQDYPIPTNQPDGKPFGLLFEALDDLKRNEVYIATGGSFNYALFGGLMSTRATQLKAAGAICDGYIRDAADIEALGFTIFSRGLYAQDQGARGRVVEYRCPIGIGMVSIMPGDLIFGDREGVLIIPQEVEQQAVQQALQKATTENKVENAIKEGMSASDSFNQFGVF